MLLCARGLARLIAGMRVAPLERDPIFLSRKRGSDHALAIVLSSISIRRGDPVWSENALGGLYERLSTILGFNLRCPSSRSATNQGLMACRYHDPSFPHKDAS
jgi:hypothetical protein